MSWRSCETEGWGRERSDLELNWCLRKSGRGWLWEEALLLSLLRRCSPVEHAEEAEHQFAVPVQTEVSVGLADWIVQTAVGHQQFEAEPAVQRREGLVQAAGQPVGRRELVENHR
jgi:hypothetical protein